MSSFSHAMYEVLQRPEYDILTGRAADYQQIIADAVERFIISLFERISLRMPDTPVYNLEAITVIFVIVAALLLLAASMGITYLILIRRGKKAATDSTMSVIFDDIANKRFTLSDLLGNSRKYAENGQFRDAVRYLYIAVLVALHDKNTIKVDKHKTNAQLAQELSLASPALLEPFGVIIDIFQQSWFGLKDVDENRFHRFAAVAEEILYGK